MGFLKFLLFLTVLILIGCGIWAFVSNRKKAKKNRAEQRSEDFALQEIKSTVLVSVSENQFSYRFANNLLRISMDEFDKSRQMYFFISEGTTFVDNITFSIEFKCKNNEPRITFRCYQKEVKIKKGDVVSILFNDETILYFTMQKNGHKVDKDMDGVLIESHDVISDADLKKLATSKIKKWRLKSASLGEPITFSLDKPRQERFQNTAKIFEYALQNIYLPENYIQTKIKPLVIHGAEFVEMKENY